MTRVAAIGECMVEIALEPDGRSATLGYGGDTLNCAVYMARAGGESIDVSYVTALGNDPFSQEMIETWQSNRVDTGLVARLAGRLPGLYVIRTDAAGERSFHYWRENAAARALLDDGRAEALEAALAPYSLIYLSGITVAILRPEARARLLALLRGALARGTKLAFDSNYRPRLWRSVEEAREVTGQFGALASIVLPSRADEEALFADHGPRAIAARWLEVGVEEVVVKDGASAAWLMTSGQTEIVPAQPAGEVIDTTAAGDSFNGTYLARRLLGDELGDAAEAAHRTAVRVIGYRGAIVPG